MGTGNCYPELVFEIDEFLAWHDAPGLQPHAYDFLTRQVSRHRKCLSFHVCRIMAAINRHQEAVYGSLLDLFIVLNLKGRPLQLRLLLAARKWLDDERYQLLMDCFNDSQDPGTLPFSPCSLFHEGVWGQITPLLDVEAPSREDARLDPLAVAKGCLEAGQVEQARELLEEELKRTPDRHELRNDLLEIYRATQDMERFIASFQFLDSVGISDPSWQEMYDWLKVQEL